MSWSRIDRSPAARRAVARWAYRLVRREWRQYALIVVLLAVSVSASVLLSSAAYSIAPAAGQAEFGDATQMLYLVDNPSPSEIDVWVAAGAEAFGTIDVIGHRTVAVPGSTRNVEYRVADVNGTFVTPMLDLRSGRTPAGGNEAAMTDGVAELLSVTIGDTIDLDGVARVLVGIVENPSDLTDEFLLVAPSELAGSDTVTMLVDASESDFRRFGEAVGPVRVGERSDVPEDVLAGVMTLLACTVVLLLVALVASASFTVIAQRRLPQFGMLSAIGASDDQIRFSVLASGAVTGIVAAVAGGVAGITAWFALVPTMESVVHHRIEASNIPWWIVITAVLLAVVAATAAAWWPARTMSRIPTVTALSGRTPRPSAPHRSALLAVGLVIAGALCLYVGSDFGERGPSLTQMLLLAGGMLAVAVGVLLVSPAVIRAIGRLAGALPIAGRLALRDLSRYQARSSSALAAIGLALGIPACIIASTAAAENATPIANLSGAQLMIGSDDFMGPFAPDADAVERTQSGVDEIVDLLGTPPAIRLDAFRDPTSPVDTRTEQSLTVSVDRPTDGGWMWVDNVYAATPALLAALGLDQSAVAGDDVVTSETGDLRLRVGEPETDLPLGPGEPITSGPMLPTTYTSLPSALIDPDAGLARGWEIIPSGRWLIAADEPIEADRLGEAREIAARYGLTIETREEDSGLAMTRRVAGLVGMFLALGVLAATVGLIRGESANDLRTLTAAGATSWMRRGIAAVTAGSLALLGAVLGIASAYIGLVAARVDHLAPLPLSDLALLAVGTPAVATVAACLLAGREPAAIGRRPLD
ncbi:MAG TPA: FtsX-like permease family protein [Ilumatobacter sp.]|nr:FtsX-like permease family protein [Ilumatobacter sp.]